MTALFPFQQVIDGDEVEDDVGTEVGVPKMIVEGGSPLQSNAPGARLLAPNVAPTNFPGAGAKEGYIP